MFLARGIGPGDGDADHFHELFDGSQHAHAATAEADDPLQQWHHWREPRFHEQLRDANHQGVSAVRCNFVDHDRLLRGVQIVLEASEYALDQSIRDGESDFRSYFRLQKSPWHQEAFGEWAREALLQEANGAPGRLSHPTIPSRFLSR